MANFQAKMFNKKASNPKNKPDQIIEAIGLRPGQSIADIGSGGGYFFSAICQDSWRRRKSLCSGYKARIFRVYQT